MATIPKVAGLAFVMADGTALFLKRSADVDNGGTWALPAGHIEGDERPIDTAIREAREETGWIAPEDAEKPKEVHGFGNGFATFKQRVTSQFIPTLNEEHTAWAWAALDDPPQPLHPGLDKMLPKLAVDSKPMDTKSPHVGGDPDRHLLKSIENATEAGGGSLHKATSSHVVIDPVIHDQMSTMASSGIPAAATMRRKAEDALKANDMTPEDWHGLVGGLLAFFSEEEEEQEHAEDEIPAAKDMNPEQWRGLVSGLLKFFGEEASEPEHAADMASDAEPKTLYVNRPLKNAAAVVAWAHSAGFKKTLPADDMHVTIAFSRTPVDWMKTGSHYNIAPDGKAIADLTVPAGGARVLERFGEAKDAVVLLFNSSRLSWRHEDIKVAGASWDWLDYQPHITITYDGADVDLSKIEPYKGELVFGPEEFAEIDKTSLVGDAALTEKETAEGKLSEGQKSEIGTVGSEKREEMPADVFLMPGSRKYPVKEKEAGGWKYNRKLLLAAARRARMNGNEALAKRADSIRAREFGGAEDDEPGKIEIDHAHDGPWMSCMRQDGGLMYMNRNLPTEVEIAGKPVNVADVLLSHEIPEWEDLENLLKVFKEQTGREPSEQEAKVLYQGAHDRSGTPSEKFYAEKNGVNWKKWSAWCRGEEARIEKGPFENQPEDADVRPIKHGHGELAAATDSALKMALDKDSVQERDRDGRLHVSETNVCKASIDGYLGAEIPDPDGTLNLDPNRIYQLFRSPEELEKAVATANGMPLLRKHIPVSAEDHQPWDVIGSMGTAARWDDPFIKNGLTVWSGDDIKKIENKKKFALSPGYHYQANMQPGTWNGEPFDGRMEKIEFNHWAVVVDGRQGDDIVIGDSAASLQWSTVEKAILELCNA